MKNLTLAILLLFCFGSKIEAITNFSVSTTNQQCFGVNDGTITVTFDIAGNNEIDILSSDGLTLIMTRNTTNISEVFVGLPAAAYRVMAYSIPFSSSLTIGVSIGATTALTTGIIGSNQIICNGNVPAALTGSASSGEDGIYTYQWYGNGTLIPGATGLNYAPPAPGLTTVFTRKVSDAHCSTNVTTPVGVTVTVNNPPTLPGSIGGATSICNNTAPAAFTSVAGTGGTAPVYQWQFSTSAASVAGDATWTDITGANSATYTSGNLTTTTYFIRKYYNSCLSLYSNIIKITVVPVTNGSIANTMNGFCYSGATPTATPPAFISVKPTGGISPWTYQWQRGPSAVGPWTNVGTSGVGGELYTPGVIGATYFYQRIENGGCGNYTTNMVEIRKIDLTAPQPTTIDVAPTCVYSTNGQLTANLTGFNGYLPYTYVWSTGATTASISGLAPGGYNVTIKESSSSGCNVTVPALLSSKSKAITLSGITSTPSCPSPLNSGSINIGIITQAPAKTPYSYSLTNTGTGITSAYTLGTANLSSATYQVWVTDVNGCTNDPAVPVTSTVLSVISPTSVISGNTTICNGAPSVPVSVVLTGSGPWNLTYTDGTTPVTVNGIATSPYTFNVSPTGTKTYTVTALTDSKCTAGALDMTGSATITVNPRPTSTLTGGVSECSTVVPATVPITFTLTGAGPFNMTYTDGVTPVTVTNISSPYVINVSPSSTKTYQVTALSDTKCTSIAADLLSTTTITVNPRPTSTLTGDTTICAGANPVDVTFTLTGTGPFDMTYSDGTNSFPLTNITSPYIISVSPLSTVTYKVIALSDSKCIATVADILSTSIITVNSIPSVSISPDPIVTCTGEILNITGNASGGSGSYINLWSGSGSIYLTATNIDNPNFSSPLAGSYALTYSITDGNGCIATETLPVDVQNGPTANAGNDTTICYDGVVHLNGSTQNSSGVLWTSSTIGTFDDPTLLNAVYTPCAADKAAGTVTLTLTAFGNGPCGSVSDNMIVTIPKQLFASIGTLPPFMIGPSTEIKVKVKTLGHTFFNNMDISLLKPDGSGGIILSKGTFRDILDLSCGALGSTPADGSGDINILYDKAVSSTFNFCNSPAAPNGTYGIEGDWNQLNGLNPAEGGWAIKIDDLVDIPGIDGVIDSAIISFTDISIITGKLVTISYDVQSPGLNITNYLNPLVDRVPMGLRTSCSNSCDAKAIVNVVGGTAPFTYLWSTGAKTQSVDLCKGSYTVTVTDALGCTSVSAVNVTSPPPVKIDNIIYSNGQTLHCFGDKTNIIIAASGGSGNKVYTYDGAPAPTDTIPAGTAFTGLAAGTYNFHVLDGNNCSKDTTITITAPAVLSSTIVSTVNILCNGGNNGQISGQGINGTQPYTYTLEKGGVPVGLPQVTNAACLFTGLIAGNDYKLSITDKYNCKTDVYNNIAITEPNNLAIGAGLIISNISCFGSTNGSINFSRSVTGGTAPYQYSIDNGVTYQTDTLFSNLGVSVHNLVVKDANGCSVVYASNPVNITEPAQIFIDNVTFTPVNTCASNNDGTIQVTAHTSAGTLEYSINNLTWSNSGSFTNVAEGSYTIRVREMSNPGCVVTNATAVIVTGPAPIVITSKIITSAVAGNPGALTVTATGGTGTLLFNLDNGTYSTTSTWSGLPVGWHYIYVMDDNLCTIKDSAYISSLTVTVTTTDVQCYGDLSGEITLSVLEAGTFKYSIDGGTTWVTTNKFSNLPAGTYLAEVSDGGLGLFIQNVVISQPVSGIGIDNVFTSDPLCYGTNSGFLSVIAHGLGTLDYSIDNGLNYQSNNTFNNQLSGTYTVLVRDNTGCTKSSIPYVLSDPAHMSITVAIVNATAVTTGQIKVTTITHGVPPFSFSIDGGVTTRTDSTFINLTAGIYTVHTVDNSGCPWDTAVIVGSGAVLDVTAIPTVNQCPGASLGDLSFSITPGQSPYTYTVQGPLNFAGTTVAPVLQFTDLPSGIYTTNIIDASGASASIVNDLTEPASFNFGETTVNAKCNQYGPGVTDIGQISLNVSGGTGPYSYAWSTGETSSSIANLQPIKYSVTVTDFNLCKAQDSIQVLADNYVFATITSRNLKACYGETVNLSGYGGISQQWSIEGLPVGSGPNAIFVAKDNGIFTFTITDISGCVADDTVHLNVSPKLGLFAGNDTVVTYRDPTVILKASGGNFASYQWTPVTSIDDHLGNTPMTLATLNVKMDSVQFIVTATSVQGCVEKDTVVIHIVDKIKIPSGFSPNNDGFNDEWIIGNSEGYPKMHVEVFNRWGERVFESTGYIKPFDGKRNGYYLPVSTYYYIIDLHDGSSPITGTVTIVSTGK